MTCESDVMLLIRLTFCSVMFWLSLLALKPLAKAPEVLT